MWFLECEGSKIIENLIPWDQNQIKFNPECSNCLHISYGKGCNLKSMDKEELFICSKEILTPYTHQKFCFGCKKLIDTVYEGFEIINSRNATQSKWICLQGWKMVEMGCFVNRKLTLNFY